MSDMHLPEQQSFSCGQENDLISRKAAIDALGKEGLITAMVIIDRVPSSQPVAKDTNVLSNDMISRQGAIDQLHQSYNLLDAERRLEDMPSTQPERAHGHWVHRGCGVFECDQCGKLVSTNVYKAEKASDSFKFCPECGVDMRGEQE